MSVETSNPAPKRRLRWLRPQFSLRTLMIGITLLCVGFAWFGMKWRQAQAQAKAVENIKKLYGNVSYESEYDKDIHGCKFGEPSRPTLSRWLPWLGRDFFESVASVDAHFREDPFGPPPVKSDVELERGRRGISAQLKDLPNCISLKLNAKFASAKELRVLPMWKNLESLSLRNSKIDGDLLDDDLLSAVGDCHQLKHLSLGDSPINDIGLAHIGQLTNLSELCIYGRLDHPSRDGLQHLSHLHKLSKLTIFDCPNADAACEVISGLRLLTEITICFSDISDNGIRLLSRCPRLRVLYISHSRVTGTGFSRAGDFQAINDLKVCHCPISDAGLKCIAMLPRLQLLSLGPGEFTNEGIASAEWTSSLKGVEFSDDFKLDSNAYRCLKKTSCAVAAEGAVCPEVELERIRALYEQSASEPGENVSQQRLVQ